LSAYRAARSVRLRDYGVTRDQHAEERCVLAAVAKQTVAHKLQHVLDIDHLFEFCCFNAVMCPLSSLQTMLNCEVCKNNNSLIIVVNMQQYRLIAGCPVVVLKRWVYVGPVA